MKFKINQISKVTGFSPSTIRFYEKAGAISPLRNENGKYRDFTLHELQLLLMCKCYRDCGYSLSESVERLNVSSFEQLCLGTGDLIQRLEKEMRRKGLLLEYLKRNDEMLQCHKENPVCCEPVTMPALLRIKMWQPGDREGEQITSKELQEWFELMPFTGSSLLLQENQLLSPEAELTTRWYLTIEEDFANHLGFSPKTKVERIPAASCIRTVVPITENLTILSQHLEPLRACLAGHQLEVAGPAITAILYHTNHGGDLRRFDQLWVPVR